MTYSDRMFYLKKKKKTDSNTASTAASNTFPPMGAMVAEGWIMDRMNVRGTTLVINLYSRDKLKLIFS